MQPVFAGAQMYGGEVSEGIFASGLNLPSGSTMSDADIERVIATVEVFLDRRAR